MKLLFAHGARVYTDKCENKYTDGSYTMRVWSRYLDLTEDFTALLRKSDDKLDEISKEKFSVIDDKKIKLITVPDLIKPKKNYINCKLRKEYNKKISEATKNADAIIVRLPSGIGETVIKYAKKYNKPYMIELVGDVLTAYWFYGNIYGKILAPIKYLRTRKLVRNAEYVNYVSTNFLQKRYPSTAKQIGCPDVVLDEPLEMIMNQRIWRIEKLYKERTVVLGLIGALSVGYRGHKTALKVVHELKKRGYDATLKFLGAGDTIRWENVARDLEILDSVEFCGALPGGKPVLEWIDNIDVLIMPTKQETLGRAIIEAMSRGCPVVGSSETAIGEQIGSDCLALSDDYMKMSDIIEKMMTNKDYMMYCAKENFYRSFKYTTKQSDIIRDKFYKCFIRENELV